MNFKINIIGDVSVGKTSIYTQYSEQLFKTETISTIGLSNFKKTIEIDNTKINLSIFDTAGNQNLKSLTQNCLRNSDIIIIVFDITKRKSFENLKEWYNLVKDTLDINQIIIGIAANKNDLEEFSQVSSNEYYDFSQKYNVDVFSINAKNYHIIEEMFMKLTEKFYYSFMKEQKFLDSFEKRKSIILNAQMLNNRKNVKKCC